MMNPRLVTPIFVFAAVFTLGFLTAASADVATMDDFSVTLNGTVIFNDDFSVSMTLPGGAAPGTVLPSGTNFSNGTPANYQVIGTIPQSGGKATLNTALAAPTVQPPPFFPKVDLNSVTLLTGPPTSSQSLTPSDTFATTGLFDLSVPTTLGGFYQVNLTDRAPENMGNGDIIALAVKNCLPTVEGCDSNTGPSIEMTDANFATGTSGIIASAPVDTNNQQILLELSHPTTGSDAIVGSYAYVNGGVEGPVQTFGATGDLFQELNYTQAGFVQLAPTPEPSSLTLVVSTIPSVLGAAWLRRRKSLRYRSEIAARTQRSLGKSDSHSAGVA